MNPTPSQPQNNVEEIDLAYIIRKIKNLFFFIGKSIFRFIQFLFKNALILGSLILIGCVSGYFMDQNKPTIYKTEIIVTPNFNSTDYLYGRIKNIQDYIVLHPSLKNVTSAEIKPIPNVYEFLADNYRNLEFARFLTENKIDLMKVTEGSEAEKIYRYHVLTVYSKEKTDTTVNELLRLLNSDTYFLERQKIEHKNKLSKRALSEKTILNIDRIFEKMGNSDNEIFNSKEFKIQSYSDLNNLLETKERLLKEINKIDIELMEQTKIIYDSSRLTEKNDRQNHYLILFPIILIAGFFSFIIARNFYLFYKTN